jgi:OFA family oxalate/formate antiporter-like MFS transporter
MYNPWFQLVASVTAMVMIANLQYAWTLFVTPIQEAMGSNLADIQLAFTIFINLQTFVQPIDGWFIDRMGPRKFISAAGLLCGVGWGALAFASSLPSLYFFYALAGIGAAFVYSGSIGSALKWFPNRRGLASGVIAAGFGGGTALFIPIIKYLIDHHTYRSAFLVTGIIQGLVILIVAQFLRYPGPGFVAKPSGSPNAKVTTRRNTEQFRTSEMLRTGHFYLMYAMFVAAATGGLFVTAQAGPLVRFWGLSAILTISTTISPLANLASRISWGWISDRLGREITMAIAFTLQALSLLAVLTFGRTSGMLFTLTVALTFFTWGEVYSLFPSTVGDYFGSRNATSNYGALYTAKGIASILAGWLAATVFDRYGTWDFVFYGTAALALMSAVGAVILRAAPLPKKAVAANAVAANVAP